MQPGFSPFQFLRKASKCVPAFPKEEAPYSHKTEIICSGQSRTELTAGKKINWVLPQPLLHAFPDPARVTKQKWRCFAQTGAGTAVINQAIIRDLSAGTKYMF